MSRASSQTGSCQGRMYNRDLSRRACGRVGGAVVGEELGGEERAALALWSVPGIGPKGLERLAEEFGSLAGAMAAPREDVCRHLNAPAAEGVFEALEAADRRVDQ